VILLNLINKFDSYHQLEQHIVACTRDSYTKKNLHRCNTETGTADKRETEGTEWRTQRE